MHIVHPLTNWAGYAFWFCSVVAIAFATVQWNRWLRAMPADSSEREPAEAAQVSPSTVAQLEAGEELKPRTVAALQSALEATGVAFIEENGEGPGVRLRKERP
jgi:hypothetical protein